MLGRESYTKGEFDQGKAAVDKLTAYRKLAKAVAGATTDKKTNAALESLEPLFFKT